MTLLQLIAHLKDIYEEHGDYEVLMDLPSGIGEVTKADIQVDTESQTITFT